MTTAQDVQDKMELLLSDARGIYIPRDFTDFTNICDADGKDITDNDVLESLEDIKNPDSETYWDSWAVVLEEVYVFKVEEDERVLYMIYQNGDLWAIPKKEVNSLDDEHHELFWNDFN